jgi:protein TonB
MSIQDLSPTRGKQAAKSIGIDREKGSTTMSARAGMSTQVQNSEPELSASKGMSVALIGPNDAHRKIVAAALGSSQGRKVHEFIDYPDKLSDLPRMLEQNFDVVLVDVDTDQSYAIQIIEKVSELGLAVMAYSARDDQDLLMTCMRAGARDFLPLPANDPGPSQVPPQAPRPAAPAQQTIPRPPEPRPAAPPPVAPSPAARSNVTTIVPEKRAETMPRFSEERAALDAHLAQAAPPPEPVPAPAADPVAPEPAISEFAEWDATHLRRGPAPPAQRKQESRPEPRQEPRPEPRQESRPEPRQETRPEPRPELRPGPSLVTERKKDETPSRTLTSDAPPAPAVERPPVSVDIFRSAQLDYYKSDSARLEKKGASWLKWVFIAAGPLVLALVLLIVFTRPSMQNSLNNAAKHPPAAEQAPEPPQPEGQLIVDATGKPSPSSLPATGKPSPSTLSSTPAPTGSMSTQQEGPKPVSPDAMAAQLVAPTRIAGNIKRTQQAEGPPPAAPAPVAFGDSGTLPGSVFGSSSKANVAAHVVTLSAGVADGMILRKTQPVYPKFAQDAHITGKVVLKATITKQGTIEGVQVISGPRILAPAAVDAVKTWKYRPYLLDDQPVAVETNISVVFGPK